MSVPPKDDLQALLEDSRAREKAQTLYYRALAAQASAASDADATERLNDLHADEQHHLSRLTARLLELGHAPADLYGVAAPPAVWDGWEEVAREREAAEVLWYEAAISSPLDDQTRGALAEILASERHHLSDLRGKWMPA